MPTYRAPTHRGTAALTLALSAATLLAASGCTTRRDAAPADTTAARMPAPADPSAAAPDSAPPPVRGTIAAASDTAITITTASGAQQLRVIAPLRIYARTKSDLAHVTPDAFVGITSVTAPDGSQRATEIHIFPEELRGTGEGSRMMARAGASAGESRMTNGAVAPSRMTNGSVSSTGSGTSYTIQYRGGTQTIAVPRDVPVTALVPTTENLSAGVNVVAVVRKGADGRLATSTIMLSGSSAPK